MTETSHPIIKTQSFGKVGSLTVVQRKNFFNEIVCFQDLMGLTFSHLTFLDCNFIDLDFKHTYFTSCDFRNFNFTTTLFLKL